MSVTGVLLTYQRQITAWADTRGYRIEPAAQRLPADALIAKVAEARPDLSPTAVMVRSEPIGAGVAHDWRRPPAVRRSLHRRRAGRGKRAGRARVLPRRGRVAPLRRGVGSEPSAGTRGHRRVESRVSLHRASAACFCGGRGPGSGRRCATSPGSRADCAARRAISTGTTQSASGRRFRWRSSSRAAS